MRPSQEIAGVGVKPAEWKQVTLFELAGGSKDLFDDGDWIESEHITTVGVRLIQTGNIGVGVFVEKDARKYIFEASFASLRCKPLVQGDLLICRLADPAGRACVLPDIGEAKVVTSVDVTIFRPPREVADRVFLCNVFSTQEWFRAVADRSGGTTHKRISRGALGRIPVTLPPMEEQRAIAATLSDMDALLAGLDRIVAKKRDLKLAVMQQLLTGQTRLPGFQGEWEVTSMKDAVGTPITDGPHLTPKFLPTGIPFLSVNNLVDNHLDFSSLRFISPADHFEFSKKCKPRRGDILFGKAASVGMVALIETDLELNIWSPLALIRVASKMCERFVYFALQASNIGRQIRLLTNASSQGNIGMSDIGLLQIPMPPLPEQRAIAAVLSDMDAELAALESRRDKTRAIKQGMMQELLTGRTRLV